MFRISDKSSYCRTFVQKPENARQTRADKRNDSHYNCNQVIDYPRDPVRVTLQPIPAASGDNGLFCFQLSGRLAVLAENTKTGGLPPVIRLGVTLQPIPAASGDNGLFCFQPSGQQAVWG
jgi:hypothetical protein